MSDKDKDAVNKAAILMLALGESEAAEVMKFLGPREVLKLGAAMAQMKACSTRKCCRC
jgi:flagellar motor switch protein FliG